ncbi:hypothetical protein AGMMS49587_05210 [Spirochaetia bacterium]|nr:hypothetical protein AGMMS49587_05210 [Spirochaetia bacterium]
MEHIEGMGRPRGCKLIRLSADMEGDVIRFLGIRGDFFASPEEEFDMIEKRLAGTPLGELAERFDTLLAEGGVRVSGINGAGVALILEAARRTGPDGA